MTAIFQTRWAELTVSTCRGLALEGTVSIDWHFPNSKRLHLSHRSTSANSSGVKQAHKEVEGEVVSTLNNYYNNSCIN